MSGNRGQHLHHVPADWADLAEHVARTGIRRVFVAGPVDAGKSVLCRVLANAARDAGRRACVLDTDLGQKMVGPPACVTLGRAASGMNIALSDLAFVGTTDPVRGWRDLVSGTARLAAAARADVLVVNTSGFLSGPGRRLKAHKIEALWPDLIVTIGENPAVAAMLGDHPDRETVRLAPSPHARRKTEGERRSLRRQAFEAYFTRGREVSFALSGLAMQRGPGPAALPPIGLLVGLADRRGRDLGIGVVSAVDAEAGTVACLTPVGPGAVARMRWGALILAKDFSDSRA